MLGAVPNSFPFQFESFVRYFSAQEMFRKTMAKKYGMELAEQNAKMVSPFWNLEF